MKVMYILDVYQKYGAADSFKQMVEYLHKYHDVEPVIVFSGEGPLCSWARDKGYKCLTTGHQGFLIDFGSTFISKLFHFCLFPFFYIRYKYCNFKALKILDRVIDFNEIALIHSNVDRNDLGALISRKYGIPHVWHLREFPPGYHFNLLSFRSNYITFMNHNADRFIAISDSVKRRWIEFGLNCKIIDSIKDGIIESDIIPKSVSDDDKFRIAMVGAICKEKGQEQLIDAICRLPSDIRNKVFLDLYGDGGLYLYHLKRKIKKSCISDNVAFKGYVTNVSSELKKYNCGVVCSKSEGLGRATIEYMYSGCSLIACDTGANLEIIESGKVGLIYKYGDIDSLCTCLKELITNSAFRKKISENAQNYAVRNFNCRKYSDNIFGVYRELI